MPGTHHRALRQSRQTAVDEFLRSLASDPGGTCGNHPTSCVGVQGALAFRPRFKRSRPAARRASNPFPILFEMRRPCLSRKFLRNSSECCQYLSSLIRHHPIKLLPNRRLGVTMGSSLRRAQVRGSQCKRRCRRQRPARRYRTLRPRPRPAFAPASARRSKFRRSFVRGMSSGPPPPAIWPPACFRDASSSPFVDVAERDDARQHHRVGPSASGIEKISAPMPSGCAPGRQIRAFAPPPASAGRAAGA